MSCFYITFFCFKVPCSCDDFILDILAFLSRVYPPEVGVRFVYALPSLDPTFGITLATLYLLAFQRILTAIIVCFITIIEQKSNAF